MMNVVYDHESTVKSFLKTSLKSVFVLYINSYSITATRGHCMYDRIEKEQAEREQRIPTLLCI